MLFVVCKILLMRGKSKQQNIEILKCTKNYVVRVRMLLPTNDVFRVQFQTQDKLLVLFVALEECSSWCRFVRFSLTCRFPNKGNTGASPYKLQTKPWSFLLTEVVYNQCPSMISVTRNNRFANDVNHIYLALLF